MLFCGDLTILLLGLAFHCFVIENRKSLCHSLGRPSRSDFVQLPFGELLQRLLIEADRTIDNREIGIALLCESVVLVFGAIEAICVCRYFKLELSEGTPFTETGAKSITKLGILFIVVDILSAAFSSAMEKFAFVSEGIEHGGGIGIGICLILLAMVVRYGAELEQRGRAK